MKGEYKVNETLRTIAERYSCRDYKKAMPSDEALKTIAEAAVQSPSARNRQAWRIIIVKDDKLIEDMQAEGIDQVAKRDDKTMYNAIMERGGRMFYSAPCMIVVAVDPNYDEYSWIDCGIVCQNIALAATSLDLGNVICGLARLAFTDPEKAEEFKKRLGFPDGYVFGCSVLLGYVNTSREPHKPDHNKISVV